MTGSKDRSGTGSLCGSLSLRAIAASVVVILALSAPHVMALQNEDFKLTASGGEANDYFGESVSLSGDLALVGAYADDDFVGSAYVFRFLPELDIKCNGLDGNVIIPYGDNVTVTIDIDACNYDGTPVVIWVVDQNPKLKNPFTYGYCGSPTWSPGLGNVYLTGGLFNDFATIVDTAVPGGGL